jgi:hypothetical protein
MPKSRKRKNRAPMKRQPPAVPRSVGSAVPVVKATSKRTRFQILRTWYGCVAALVTGLAALTGLILFADWLLDQYSESFPRVSVNSADNNLGRPILFNIANTSKYLNMYRVRLICSVRDDLFTNRTGGKLEFTGPLESGVQAKEETVIMASTHAIFPCDPELAESTSVDVAHNERLKRIMSEIHVKSDYQIRLGFWNRTIKYDSPLFYCSYYRTDVKCYDNKIVDIDLLPNFGDLPP